MDNLAFVERLLRGLLREEITPAQLTLALHNVLACGRGHELADVTIYKSDDDLFTALMTHLGLAAEMAQKIEGE